MSRQRVTHSSETEPGAGPGVGSTDFVEQVDAGDVDAVALHDVDQIIGGGVAAQSHVGVVDLILPEDRLHHVHVQLRLLGLVHTTERVTGAGARGFWTISRDLWSNV